MSATSSARSRPSASAAGRRSNLLTYVALRLRVARTLSRGRFVAAVACASLVPVALAVPALVALTLVAAVWVALHGYEIILVARGSRAYTRVARARLRLWSISRRRRPEGASIRP